MTHQTILLVYETTKACRTQKLSRRRPFSDVFTSLAPPVGVSRESIMDNLLYEDPIVIDGVALDSNPCFPIDRPCCVRCITYFQLVTCVTRPLACDVRGRSPCAQVADERPTLSPVCLQWRLDRRHRGDSKFRGNNRKNLSIARSHKDSVTADPSIFLKATQQNNRKKSYLQIRAARARPLKRNVCSKNQCASTISPLTCESPRSRRAGVGHFRRLPGDARPRPVPFDMNHS
ncbi:hypothetical protein EVAR_92591_1 [Eumeta japonica]|uniref:Uncharacterized protein n=1 Tax=Eumeta variegata TaxID=151549 RepID=A0A4C1SZC0_EUMVA|nr:hypothetical protein EVAR_92591_1 [Eumeta japonica]